MVEAIIRSPGSFFDVTPSGILNNKFSNDLGILDNTLIFSFIDTTEGSMMSLVAVVYLIVLNLYLIVPIVIFFTISLLFLIYAKTPIIKSKELDL